MNHDDFMRTYYDVELPTRTGLAADSPRSQRRADFIETCRTRGLQSVLEVGSGAGHDGGAINGAGLRYVGTDLSAIGVGLARSQRLDAVQASAVALPFQDRVFDAAWSMSTLMHLPGEDIVVALAELVRVIRPGGLLEVGVWGSGVSGTRIDDHGRFFRQRTDAELMALYADVGDLADFATWDCFEDGGHYQWGRIVVGRPG